MFYTTETVSIPVHATVGTLVGYQVFNYWGTQTYSGNVTVSGGMATITPNVYGKVGYFNVSLYEKTGGTTNSTLTTQFAVVPSIDISTMADSPFGTDGLFAQNTPKPIIATEWGLDTTDRLQEAAYIPRFVTEMLSVGSVEKMFYFPMMDAPDWPNRGLIADKDSTGRGDYLANPSFVTYGTAIRQLYNGCCGEHPLDADPHHAHHQHVPDRLRGQRIPDDRHQRHGHGSGQHQRAVCHHRQQHAEHGHGGGQQRGGRFGARLFQRAGERGLVLRLWKRHHRHGLQLHHQLNGAAGVQPGRDIPGSDVPVGRDCGVKRRTVDAGPAGGGILPARGCGDQAWHDGDRAAHGRELAAPARCADRGAHERGR